MTQQLRESQKYMRAIRAAIANNITLMGENPEPKELKYFQEAREIIEFEEKTDPKRGYGFEVPFDFDD